MIEIDHVCLAVRNFYEGSQRLLEETGLGHYEGGWFPTKGLANRIFPLGDDTYIEVESAIDTFAYAQGNPAATFFHDVAKDGDVFLGWCARTDSREELLELGLRSGMPVVADSLRVRPDGSTKISERVPDSGYCWRKGIPNLFLVEPDQLPRHPSRIASQFGTKKPTGIDWMEVGGSRAEMASWLGDDAASNMPLQYNGKAPGIYALAVNTDHGQVVIQRRSLLEPFNR